MSEIKIDEALVAYVGIRDNVVAKETEFKAWKKEQKEMLSKLELFFKARCDELGTDSLKAGGNTAFTTTKDSVAIEDKEAFRLELAKGMAAELSSLSLISTEDVTGIAEAIASAPVFDLLTLSANKVNCKSFMADNNGLMPTGIKYHNEKVIQVRKGK
jgi:hypothetical protein